MISDKDKKWKSMLNDSDKDFWSEKTYLKDYTMESRIYDEKNGLWYELQNDYYLPCLTLTEEENQFAGIWGQRHVRYLKEYRKVLYMNLLTSGKPNTFLADIDKQAEEMFSRFVKQVA